MTVFRGTRLWHVCDGTSVARGTSFSVQLLLLATSRPVVVTDRRTPFDFAQSTFELVSTNGCRQATTSCLVLTPALVTATPLSSFFLFCDVLNRFQLKALISAECFFRLFSSAVPLCCCSPPLVILQLFSELLLLLLW